MNMNDRVRVKLTNHGKLICTMAAYSVVNHNGMIELPLWELMQIFGPRIHMGMPHMFFVDNEIEVIE